MEGFVYALTNQAMPGFVKIGYATGDLTARIRTLNNTSVPFEFECAHAVRVADCERAERLIHRIFADKRANPRREFFLVEVEQAKAALDLAAAPNAGAAVTPSLDDVIPDPAERDAVRRIDERRRAVSLADLGIAEGAVLTLDRDEKIRCVVTGHKRIEYRGQEMSLSAAALDALRGLGYEWPTANGWAHWMFEGRVLRDLVSEHLGRE